MDKSAKYYAIIEHWLHEYAQIRSVGLEDLHNHVLSDSKNGHLQLMREGWEGKDFHYNIIFHFQIKTDGKIWVLVNNTDNELVQDFKKPGIQEEDLIPAFIPEAWRKLAGYAA